MRLGNDKRVEVGKKDERRRVIEAKNVAVGQVDRCTSPTKARWIPVIGDSKRKGPVTQVGPQ